MEHVWVFLGLCVCLCHCQDRIIFRDENGDDSTFRRIPTPVNYAIPERLLIQIKDIRNPTEFFNQFVARSDVFDNDSANITGRRALASATASAVAQPASCQTEQQVVELDKVDDGAILLWPNCVRVRRCGGCCTSKMLTCNAITTSIINVTVFELRYNPQNPDAFESRGTRVFSLEQHDHCACSCKERPEDCTPGIHIYSANECRCVCTNQQLVGRCTHPKKIWDNRDCICKCRTTQQCSTGRYFNIIRCRCEAIRLSLAGENNDRRNSTQTRT